MKKNNCYKALLLFILLLPFIVVAMCNIATTRDKKILQCLRLTRIFPVFSETGNILSYDTSSIDISFHERTYIYMHTYDFYNTSDSTMMREKTKVFFLKHIDSVNGHEFNSKMKIHNQVASDALLKFFETYTNLNLKEVFERYPLKLMSKYFDQKNETLIEEYEGTVSETPNYKLTWRMMYSKEFDDSPFHLSEYMDSGKSLKLYSLQILNPTYKTNTITRQAWVNEYKLEKIKCEDEELIFKYLNEYLKK